MRPEYTFGNKIEGLLEITALIIFIKRCPDKSLVVTEQ